MSSTPSEPWVLPDGGPATVAGAREAGAPSAEPHTARLTKIVAAVNEQVRTWRVARLADGKEAWPESVQLGANMLVVRLFRRKDTPGGVEAMGEFGIAYVRRLDPDVAELLELGEWSKPSVG